jgi:hypothetical protein
LRRRFAGSAGPRNPARLQPHGVPPGNGRHAFSRFFQSLFAKETAQVEQTDL